MKKYLYFVIPIIILLVIGLAFIWLYTNKKDATSPLIDKELNQISNINDESINVIETEVDSPAVPESEEILETQEESKIANKDEVINKENTSKQTSFSTAKKEITTKNTTDTSKKEESKVTVKEEKTEATKPDSTQDTEQSTPKQDSTTSIDNTSQEVKKEETIVRCTNNNNHGMSVGNTGKWFSSKDEAVAYYKSQIKYWGDWWENTDADDTEADEIYNKNCPSGYEVWSCMYCSKWTINFYYR